VPRRYQLAAVDDHSRVTDELSSPAVVLADSEIREIASGDGYYFAAWRQAYVLDWRSTVTFESLDAAVRGKRAVLADHPDGVIVFNLLRPSELPSSKVRAYAEKKQSEDVAGVLSHVTVIDAEGFWASAMRSTLAGLYLVGKSPFPRKVFGSVDDGATWARSFTREPIAWTRELVAAIRAIRAR
jgi:hypothetical protein